MNVESKLQAEIIKFLKARGVYIINTRPQPGTPTGCPDIIGLYGGAWLAIEVKASLKSGFRPGQRQTLARFSDWSPFVYVAYPENWPEIKAGLLHSFF